MLDTETGNVYCDYCGDKIGNYLTEDFFRLIRQKYCKECKAKIYAGQHREAERARRRRQKYLKKEQSNQIKEFTKMTALLIEQNKLLQEQVERLKQEGRR